jgi:TonB family protein
MKLLIAILLLFFQSSQPPSKWECCKDSRPLPKEQLLRVKPTELKERVVARAVPRLPAMFDGQSTVIFQVQIDEEGNIRCARVISGGQNSIMKAAAIEAAKEWRFEPLIVDGQAKPYVGILAMLVSWDKEKSEKQCPKEKRRA